MYQASTTPGTVAESRPSLSGSLPPLFLLYHSIVASFGAGPSALIDYTFLVFGVVDEDDGVAAEAVGGGIDEREHGLPGDGGVERVAARLEDADRRLRRLMLHRADRVLPSRDHRLHRPAASRLRVRVVLCERLEGSATDDHDHRERSEQSAHAVPHGGSGAPKGTIRERIAPRQGAVMAPE